MGKSSYLGVMKAIHLICKRDDGLNLNNLTYDKVTRTHRSGHWDITLAQAGALVGGWLYLHPSKASPSEFGGNVQSFDEVTVEGLARPRRIVLTVRSSRDGKGQKWRGAAHSMAYSGSLVDAALPHEQPL